MVETRRIARLGTLVVGLGIGAAWANMPIAAADNSNDLLSSIDGLVSGAVPAAGSTTTDFQISFDGMTLLPTAGNEATATTVAGQFGLAIAYGDGANATAEGGTGDYALASGTDANAEAGSLTVGATGNNYDSAIDIGNNVSAGPPLSGLGGVDGAYAGAGSLVGNVSSSGTDSNNTAIDIGNNGLFSSLGYGGHDGAFAGDGALLGLSGAGNGNTAYVDGNITGAYSGAGSGAGNDNFASLSGSDTNTSGSLVEAGFGNDNTAIADTSYTTSGVGVTAGSGNDNYAYVYGPDNSTAGAGGNEADITSSNDISYVLDPTSTDPASSAFSGSETAASGHDLAEVLFTHGSALAENAPLLYDIITAFGPFTGTF
jgi:hypothetical protein